MKNSASLLLLILFGLLLVSCGKQNSPTGDNIFVGGNQLPILATIDNQTTNENVNLNFVISATDIESIPTLTYSALPTGASFVDNGDGTGTFNWTPDFLQSGSYPITFTATDDSSAIDIEVITITVRDAIHWVGSEAIFTSIEGKKDYSILFFYADWCGYCLKMDEITFSDSTVVSIMSQFFNSVRVNAESDSLLVHFDSTVTGRQMKTIYEVNGYPSIRIFKGDGEYLTSVVGYTNPADFAAGLNRVLSGEYE